MNLYEEKVLSTTNSSSESVGLLEGLAKNSVRFEVEVANCSDRLSAIRTADKNAAYAVPWPGLQNESVGFPAPQRLLVGEQGSQEHLFTFLGMFDSLITVLYTTALSSGVYNSAALTSTCRSWRRMPVMSPLYRLRIALTALRTILVRPTWVKTCMMRVRSSGRLLSGPASYDGLLVWTKTLFQVMTSGRYLKKCAGKQSIRGAN